MCDKQQMEVGWRANSDPKINNHLEQAWSYTQTKNA